MTPSRDRPRDRDELEDRLEDLEDTLSELRSELRSEQRRGPPKPPSLSELLRFTEEYTIPTLIALLEATIQSLELLRRTLRLADPGRAVEEEGRAARSRFDRVGNQASNQLAGALSELRTALSETDLPDNPESRRLIEDARDLTGEIEGRLRDAERSIRDSRDQERRDGRDTGSTRNRGVMIDVTDAAGDGRREADGADSEAETEADDEAPEVDVESELESIKDELDRSQRALDEADEANADPDTPEDSQHADDEDGTDETDETNETDDRS